MKKLLVLLSLSLFIFGSFTISSVYAERSKSAIVKDIILKKRELIKNNSKGTLYVSAIDSYIEKNKTDITQIKKIVSNLSIKKVDLQISGRSPELIGMIEYLIYKGELLLVGSDKNSNALSKHSDKGSIIRTDPEFVLLRTGSCNTCEEILNIVYGDGFTESVKISSFNIDYNVYINGVVDFKELLKAEFGSINTHPHVLITSEREFITDKNEIITVLKNAKIRGDERISYINQNPFYNVTSRQEFVTTLNKFGTPELLDIYNKISLKDRSFYKTVFDNYLKKTRASSPPSEKGYLRNYIHLHYLQLQHNSVFKRDFINLKEDQSKKVSKIVYLDLKILRKGNASHRTIGLDSTASYISDEEIISYSYDFGDGTSEVGKSIIPSYTYKTAGNYNIELIATSSNGTRYLVNRLLIITE